MTSAEIYLAAAKLLESGDVGCHVPGCGLSCCSLSRVLGRITDESNKLYFALKEPYVKRFGDEQWWNGPNTPDNQRARIAALREMARTA